MNGENKKGLRQSATTLRWFYGGADRDRTDDLCVANASLSQLSYSPSKASKVPEKKSTVKRKGAKYAFSLAFFYPPLYHYCF